MTQIEELEQGVVKLDRIIRMAQRRKRLDFEERGALSELKEERREARAQLRALKKAPI